VARSIYDLCQPFGGLMSYPHKLSVGLGEPRFEIYASGLGDLDQLTIKHGHNMGNKMDLNGAGGDYERDKAVLKALAETLERYCSTIYREEQFIWAAAEELEDAFDLDTIPVCSDEEVAHPLCPIRKPNKQEKIRWVRGVSLTHGKPVWVPAVMVYLYIPYKNDAERFWLPISTGCAIHTSYEQALINGILEVIERDAISLTWLHKLPLMRIEFDIESLSPWAQAYMRENEKYPYVKTYYFNATTDLGIPTIYSVQISEHNKKLHTVVMCTTELDPEVALTKIVREAASVRIALQHKESQTSEVDRFMSVFDGALYMGASEMKEHFDFLLKSEGVYPFSQFRNLSTGQADKDLKYLLSVLQDNGHEVIAVDLTTDEASRSGLYAVRVIIPGLQPLSFSLRARYLGHKRLYTAPEIMGYGRRTEQMINPMPQPFA